MWLPRGSIKDDAYGHCGAFREPSCPPSPDTHIQYVYESRHLHSHGVTGVKASCLPPMGFSAEALFSTTVLAGEVEMRRH